LTESIFENSLLNVRKLPVISPKKYLLSLDTANSATASGKQDRGNNDNPYCCRSDIVLWQAYFAPIVFFGHHRFAALSFVPFF